MPQKAKTSSTSLMCTKGKTPMWKPGTFQHAKAVVNAIISSGINNNPHGMREI
jgi:hypothetical protein